MADDGQDDGGPSLLSMDQEVEQWELDSLSDTDSSAASSLRSSSAAPSDGAGGAGDDLADEVEQVELDSLSDDSSDEGSGSEQLSRLRCENSSGSSLVEKADLDSSDEDEEPDSGADSQPVVQPAAEERREPDDAAAAAALPLPEQPEGPASPPAAASPPADDGPVDWGEQLESIQTPAPEDAWPDAAQPPSPPLSPQPPPLAQLLEDAPIGQRTRARNPLRDVTIEELEALLQDDLQDSDAEDDAAYQEFLQALQGDVTGDEPVLLPEEGDDASDADWMFDLEELLDAGEEGWLDAPPAPSPLRTRHARAAGLLDGEDAGQAAQWVPQEHPGPDADARPLADGPAAGVRARRQASKRPRSAGSEDAAAASEAQRRRAEQQAAARAAASEGLAAMARAQADAIMRQQELREQYREWKRQERRRSLLKAQRRRQRAAQGLPPEAAQPAAAAAAAAGSSSAAAAAAAGQQAAGQPGQGRAAAAAAPAPSRRGPRLTSAAAAQRSGLQPLVPGKLAVAIPAQPQQQQLPPAGAVRAAWTPSQLAHLRKQVDSHLQLLCHGLSLLAGGGPWDQLAQCRAMLLHMATVCVQSLGVAELAQQQPPASQSVLAAPVLPHVVPLVAAVDAAGRQPRAAQAPAAAGGAPSLPTVPGPVQQVLAAMGPLLSEELRPKAAALPRGYTAGEAKLLRMGLRRVGPQPPLLQRFFLPTKSLDSIRGYIRVEADRARAAGAGPQAPLVLSSEQLATVRAAVQQQRGADSVWDALSAGPLRGRTATEVRDAYWRQGYGAARAWPSERAAARGLQPAAAPTQASAAPRQRAARGQARGRAARGGRAARVRGGRRGRAAEAAEQAGDADSPDEE